ncbi:MAG: hypothetical protein ACFFD1_02905 [Candidatus Thorarchaeota archaeon]
MIKSFYEKPINKKILLFTSFFVLWVFSWSIEFLSYYLGFIQEEPYLIFPDQFNIDTILLFLLRLMSIFPILYLIEFLGRKDLFSDIKISLQDNGCWIHQLGLFIIGFDCLLPIIDQIKNLEDIETWEPFSLYFNWLSGKITIFFYFFGKNNDSNENYGQIKLFLDRSFSKTTLIPPYMLKNLLSSSLYTNKSIFNPHLVQDYYYTKEELSSVFNSLEENVQFIQENMGKDYQNAYLSLIGIKFWFFKSDSLTQFVSKVDLFNQSLFEYSGLKLLFLPQTQVFPDELSKLTKISNFGLPPINMITTNVSSDRIYLILYVINKWMKKKQNITFKNGFSDPLNEKINDTKEKTFKTIDNEKIRISENSNSYLEVDNDVKINKTDEDKFNKNITTNLNNLKKKIHKSVLNSFINKNNTNKLDNLGISSKSESKNNSFDENHLKEKASFFKTNSFDKSLQQNIIEAISISDGTNNIPLITNNNSEKESFDHSQSTTLVNIDPNKINEFFNNNTKFSSFCTNFCPIYQEIKESCTKPTQKCQQIMRGVAKALQNEYNKIINNEIKDDLLLEFTLESKKKLVNKYDYACSFFLANLLLLVRDNEHMNTKYELMKLYLENLDHLQISWC